MAPAVKAMTDAGEAEEKTTNVKTQTARCPSVSTCDKQQKVAWLAESILNDNADSHLTSCPHQARQSKERRGSAQPLTKYLIPT